MANLIYHHNSSDDPESVLDSYLEKISELLLSVTFKLERYWLPGTPIDHLSVVYRVTGDTVYLAVSDKKITLPENMQLLSDADAFEKICRQNELTAFDLGGPVMLGPLHIAKPWGQEIWYTGIESRGVCKAAGNTEHGAGNVELPWLLAAAPKRLTAGLHRQLILLKILDPLPVEVLGDLYFELHEEKREVYVVTHVDSKAWPDGKGAIRLGFSQTMRAGFNNDEEFRQAYLGAVSRYRRVRDEIDGIIDNNKVAKGLDLNSPVAPKLYAELALKIPSELRKAEQQAREQMDEFTCLKTLAVGDVVKVPTYTPHALQHGVRTVEFQTPVYERMILSFGQKVLTQKNWDTARAVEAMSLDLDSAYSDLELDAVSDGVVSELVVEFEDFRVLRISCQPGSCYSLVARSTYQILMMVQGRLQLLGLQVGPEQACLVPACYLGGKLVNNNPQVMVFLLAQPS